MQTCPHRTCTLRGGPQPAVTLPRAAQAGLPSVLIGPSSCSCCASASPSPLCSVLLPGGEPRAESPPPRAASLCPVRGLSSQTHVPRAIPPMHEGRLDELVGAMSQGAHTVDRSAEAATFDSHHHGGILSSDSKWFSDLPRPRSRCMHAMKAEGFADQYARNGQLICKQWAISMQSTCKQCAINMKAI